MRRSALSHSSCVRQRVPWFVAALALMPALALAQGGADSGHARAHLVRVRVLDTAGVPVAGASVSIVRGLEEIVAQAATDQSGQRALSIATPSGQYDLMVRKIGYARADRFFNLVANDSASFQLVLTPSVQTLAPVNVTAQENAKRRTYYIDADAIANSSRLIMDGMDILTKLRPDMMMNPTPGSMDRCAVDAIWVNGAHITLPPRDTALAVRRAMKVHGAGFASPDPRWGPALAVMGDARVSVDVQSVLASIHPEHIGEITFHDCNDVSMPGVATRNALFVVLKPGVAYSPGIGSYVLNEDNSTAGKWAAARELARMDSAATVASHTTTLDPFRHRLLGLFDSASGEPLPGVDVVDSTSGSWVRTSETGIVSLAFLPPGASTVRLRRAGVPDTLIHVTISPRDTTPITLTLARPR